MYAIRAHILFVAGDERDRVEDTRTRTHGCDGVAERNVEVKGKHCHEMGREAKRSRNLIVVAAGIDRVGEVDATDTKLVKVIERRLFYHQPLKLYCDHLVLTCSMGYIKNRSAISSFLRRLSF